MISENFIYLGAFLNACGTAVYLTAALKGRTQPNKVAWFLWALAPLIAFAAQISEGVGLPALMTFTVGFGPLLIFLASFVNRKSYWKLTRFDWICGGLSLSALGLWGITENAVLAIALSVGADFLAGIPVLVKAYTHPESEHASAFAFGIANASLTLLAINHWTFASASFPAYILAFDLVITLVILKLHRKPEVAPA